MIYNQDFGKTKKTARKERQIPTEHERKFIINSDCESTVRELSSEKLEISQGYLTKGKVTNRIRKSVSSNGKSEYFFTLKVNVGRCIEVEKKIDKRDFEDLWSVCSSKVSKIRYIVKNNKEKWEIDFLKHKKMTYIAVAEIELPETEIAPKEIIDIVKSNMIYEVGLNDSRFSNKLLSNVEYATELLSKIYLESKNEVSNR